MYSLSIPFKEKPFFHKTNDSFQYNIHQQNQQRHKCRALQQQLSLELVYHQRYRFWGGRHKEGYRRNGHHGVDEKTIDVTRTILTMGTDGQLVEDVRFNRPAKDSDSYTDEGIYTFTVKNLYTGESTTKTIYVGSDKYLLALSKNSLTVEGLNEKIERNAVISDDGTISDQTFSENPSVEISESEVNKIPLGNSSTLLVIVVLAGIIGGVTTALAIRKNAKKKKEGPDI